MPDHIRLVGYCVNFVDENSPEKSKFDGLGGFSK
jgi:hypothetical protein